MKVIVSIVLVLGMLSFAQCSNQKPGKELGEFNRVDSISIQDINYPELLGIGLQVIKMDSLFIVNDFWGDSLLNIYNANTHKVERKLISKGNGPDEMSSPLDVKIIQDKIYVLSRPRFQFAYLLKDSIFTNNKMYGHTMLPQMSDCFLPLNDSVFVFSGMWEKRYALYQKGRADSLRFFGEYPDFWEKEKNFPTMAKAMFHQSQLAKHPSKNLFATSSRYALDVYSYDPTGKKLPTLAFRKQLGNYYYQYTTGDITMVSESNDSDPQIKGIFCSDRYIYLLREVKEDENASDILMIDWDGAPKRILKSNKRIDCLFVDENEHRGYCIILDPESKFCHFEIPE